MNPPVIFVAPLVKIDHVVLIYGATILRAARETLALQLLITCCSTNHRTEFKIVMY